MTACAMEQGLYSLFAGYDRTLLGHYELFFYNGGDKSGVWKPETMSRKSETAGEVLSPTASGMGILSGSFIWRTGYRSLSRRAIVLRQTRGKCFLRQICEAMKASLGTYEYSSFPEIKRRTGNRETSGGRTERLRGRGGLNSAEELKQPEEGTEKQKVKENLKTARLRKPIRSSRYRKLCG